jgi:hypothetical protein
MNKTRKSAMKTRKVLLAGCLFLTCAVILSPLPPRAGAAEEDLEETIDYLLEYVRNSDVTFIRNNKEHTPEEAAGHIMRKYRHYRKKIKTPEDFIRLSATKSTMSGKQYSIRTTDGVTMTSAEWLTRALEEYRRAGAPPSESFATRAMPGESKTAASPPAGASATEAASEMELNLESPDSSRYEIRTFERDSGNCDEPRRNCAEVRLSYPDIIETPFVDAEHALNAFILQALLKPRSGEERMEDPEDLAGSFFAEYRKIKQDMPDYGTGWFLERNIGVLHNTPRILSLDLNEAVYTGGAHPNSRRVYVSLDVPTGMTITLSDILMDDQVKALNEIAEHEFRKLKQVAPDKGLDEAGFWFDDGKFELNDNFAITGEGLVFYFNSYEIASYADGPTRLVIPGEDLKPLLRKDRLEWFEQSR